MSIEVKELPEQLNQIRIGFVQKQDMFSACQVRSVIEYIDSHQDISLTELVADVRNGSDRAEKTGSMVNGYIACLSLLNNA